MTISSCLPDTSLSGMQTTIQNLREQPQAPAALGDEGETAQATSGVGAATAQMEASVRVHDMALTVMDEAANQLIQSMAAITGVGQNVNVLA
ncbi:MAG: hypothetical protein FWB97_01130 [Oscillospiraceae bacterium]|nr:hypothetical protein [Oscillospiraceae bacterium]